MLLSVIIFRLLLFSFDRGYIKNCRFDRAERIAVCKFFRYPRPRGSDDFIYTRRIHKSIKFRSLQEYPIGRYSSIYQRNIGRVASPRTYTRLGVHTSGPRRNGEYEGIKIKSNRSNGPGAQWLWGEGRKLSRARTTPRASEGRKKRALFFLILP